MTYDDENVSAQPKPEPMPGREAIKIVENSKQELLAFVERSKAMAEKYRNLAEFYSNEADVVVSFLQTDYYAAQAKAVERPEW